MGGGAGDSSSEEAIVSLASRFSVLSPTSSGITHLAPLLSTLLSVPTTANQSEVIAQFLLDVRSPPVEGTGNLATMRDSLSIHLRGRQPPQGNS